MARKRTGWLVGQGGECRIAPVISRDHLYTDYWCTHHAQYICKCRVCGISFHSDRPHTLYCSTAHSQLAYRQRKAMSNGNQ